MKWCRLVLCVIICFVGFESNGFSFESDGWITGQVTNAVTDLPIPDVKLEAQARIIDTLPDGTLFLRGLDQTVPLGLFTQTDDQGQFAIKIHLDSNQKCFKITVKRTDYQEAMEVMVRVETNKTTQLNLQLIPTNLSPEAKEIIDEKHEVLKQKAYQENPSYRQEPSPWVSTPPQDLQEQRNRGFGLSAYPVPDSVFVYKLQGGYNGYTGKMLLDEYISAVASKEMGGSFSMQALRVQAVAARSYALEKYIRTDTANGGQVCTTYIPLNCRTATFNTSKIVILYSGSVIRAFYSARCNGDSTLNSEDGVWGQPGDPCWVGGSPYPYARARRCSDHQNCQQHPEPYCCTVSAGGRLVSVYGHGVGMCQRGTEKFVNDQGKIWRWILLNYYTGVELANDLQVGDRVQATANLNVRDTPGGNQIGQVSDGAVGSIIDGPQEAYYGGVNYVWWKITWDGSITGWSIEDWIKKIPGVDNPPIVSTFNVNPSSVILGGSFTISYTVTDDIDLRRVELWDSCASCTQWVKRDSVHISGTSYAGSFSYAPSDTGTYWIGVHVVDNAEQCSHEPNPPGPAQRTVTPPVPSAPALASPSNGLTGVPTNPTLTWNASNWATSYRLQVSTSSSFTTTVVDQSGITATSYPVSGLTSGTLYYWHVNASNVSGPSSWSDTWSFTTSAPASPTIAYDPTSFSFTATQGGANPQGTLCIWNSGGGTLNWTVSDNQTWLSLSPTSGSSSGEPDTVFVSVNMAGLDTGNYSGQITISAPGATTQYVPVTLRINPSGAPIVYIAINPTSVNFGSVVIGQFADATITITNQSGSTGTLNGSVGSLSAPFSVIAGGGSFSLSPGQSRSVVVRFTPTSPDSLFASLSITHNATNQSSPTIVSLNGKGTEQPSGCQWQVAGTIALSGSQLLSYMATNNGKLYVGRYPNLLTVIDLSSNTTVANIPFGSFVYCTPGHIAVSGNRAYVALSNLGSDGQLAVVNTDDDSIVTYVPVGADPWGVATFGNRVYVTNNVWWANGDPATVLVIDKGTNMILDTIYVGKNPNCINVDPSSAKAYVTNGNSLSRSVSVINTATNSVVATIQIPNGQPSGVAINNNCAYVSKIIDNMPGTVEVINTTTDSIVQSIPVGRDPIGIAVYNQYIFITNNSSNTVTIIDTASNALVRTLNVGNHPFGIAVDPMSNKVYVGNQSDRTISIIDCPTSVETTTELLPKEYVLHQNYPNPFNPETVIEYILSKHSQVKISIYNIVGQKVRTLLSEYQTAGEKKTDWDGKDDRGNDLASGIYFYRLQAGDFSQTRRMVLLR